VALALLWCPVIRPQDIPYDRSATTIAFTMYPGAGYKPVPAFLVGGIICLQDMPVLRGDNVTRREPRSSTREVSEAGQRKIAAAELDRLIEEATVDCHDESEQISGFYNMLEENIELPFETQVLGVEVTVEHLDLTDAEEIVAVCRRGQARQVIPILHLPLPTSAVRGAEWIEAYRRWSRGRF
jgi:hypothetical protein